MLALAAAGIGEGEWLRAERQTAGRGREGRAWISPPGNLYASTLVRLRPGDPPAPGLALVAGVVMAEVVAGVLAQQPVRFPKAPPAGPGGITLKWPNDVLLGGRKLAGILLERASDAVVIGIGVNLASHPDGLDRLATSLAVHGLAIGPDTLLKQIAGAMPALVARWRAEGLGAVRRLWLDHAHPVGAPLTARLPDGSVLDGRFAGLTGEGALRLGLAGGEERVIHAGDVFAI